MKETNTELWALRVGMTAAEARSIGIHVPDNVPDVAVLEQERADVITTTIEDDVAVVNIQRFLKWSRYTMDAIKIVVEV